MRLRAAVTAVPRCLLLGVLVAAPLNGCSTGGQTGEPSSGICTERWWVLTPDQQHELVSTAAPHQVAEVVWVDGLEPADSCLYDLQGRETTTLRLSMEGDPQGETIETTGCVPPTIPVNVKLASDDGAVSHTTRGYVSTSSPDGWDSRAGAEVFSYRLEVPEQAGAPYFAPFGFDTLPHRNHAIELSPEGRLETGALVLPNGAVAVTSDANSRCDATTTAESEGSRL